MDKGALGQVVVECVVGDTVKVCHSINYKGADDSGLLKGFRVINLSLGSLSKNKEWNCVNYLHENPGTQIIEFIENMSSRSSSLQINGNIPIHDHASIPQGGPAYATYYSEIEEDDTGE